MRTVFIIIAIFFTCFSNVFSISSIGDIYNPQMRFSYDGYTRSILSYENKLIINNLVKTEELLILPSGDLASISSFGDSAFGGGFVYADTYILPKNDMFNVVGFYVFDLTQTHMQLVANVDLNGIVSLETAVYKDNTFFSNTHILVGDIRANRIVKICNETYAFDGYLGGLAGGFIEKIDDDFLQISQSGSDLVLRILSLNESNDFIEISSLIISGFGSSWNQINVVDSKIAMNTPNYLLIIDINNHEQPYISTIIHQTFTSFLYTDSRIYAFENTRQHLEVYELDGDNNYILNNSISVPKAQTSNYSIHLVSPYLFFNAGYALLVFDTLNDYQIIHHYGHGVGLPIISTSPDDIYFMRDCFITKTQKLYSIIDSALVATLYYEHLNPRDNSTFFQIVNDRLYVLVTVESTSYLDIYMLENGQATLLHREYVTNNSLVANLSIIGNKIFIRNSTQYQTIVYNIDNDILTFLGVLPGYTQFYLSQQPNEFVLNIYNGSLFVRSIADIFSVDFEKQIDYILPNTFVYYFDNNYFSLLNTTPSSSVRHYSFNIFEDSYNLLASHPSSNLTSFNRHLSITNSISNTSDFYTIQDNIVTLIGSKEYGKMGTIFYTYFFPDREKKVLITEGGIWVYDVEYSTSDEDIVILPIKNELLKNYPNPFNPETTISFILQKDSHVSLDIYNIRGQKVKSLVSDFKTSGNHQVIWRGTDENGLSVSNGIYFYKMQTRDFTATKRMLLLK